MAEIRGDVQRVFEELIETSKNLHATNVEQKLEIDRLQKKVKSETQTHVEAAYNRDTSEYIASVMDTVKVQTAATQSELKSIARSLDCSNALFKLSYEVITH